MSFVTALWRAGAAARGLSTPTHIAPFVVSATSGVGGVFGAPTAPLMQAAAAAAAAEGVGASGTKPSGSPITKADLVKTVAAAHSMSQAQSKRIVDTVFGTISETLAEKKKIKIAGLGSFSTYESRPRVARNPRDQTKIDVPAKTRIRFKATSALKETVQTKS